MAFWGVRLTWLDCNNIFNTLELDGVSVITISIQICSVAKIKKGNHLIYIVFSHKLASVLYVTV